MKFPEGYTLNNPYKESWVERFPFRQIRKTSPDYFVFRFIGFLIPSILLLIINITNGLEGNSSTGLIVINFVAFTITGIIFILFFANLVLADIYVPESSADVIKGWNDKQFMIIHNFVETQLRPWLALEYGINLPVERVRDLCTLGFASSSSKVEENMYDVEEYRLIENPKNGELSFKFKAYRHGSSATGKAWLVSGDFKAKPFLAS